MSTPVADFHVFTSELTDLGVLYRSQSNDLSVWIRIADFDGETLSMNENLGPLDDLLVQQVHSALEKVAQIAKCPPLKTEISEAKRLVAQQRWKKREMQENAKREFAQRMQQWRTAKQIRNGRADAAVQCSMASAPELLRSWMSAHLPANTASLIVNCVNNADKGSPRYTSEIWDIAMCLYLSSAKTYQLMRQILQMPAVSTLYEHYSALINHEKQRLMDDSQIAESLRQVCKQIDAMHACTQFTLAIDAFSFRTFTPATVGARSQTRPGSDPTATAPEYSNGFLMLLIPLDYRLSVKLVHLELSTTGAYNAEINKKAEFIMRTANEMGIRIWFRATDGDPGVANSHNDFYEQHVRGRTSNYGTLITSVWSWLCGDCQSFVPVSDPLHIFKNIRARFIASPISLFPNCVPTNIESVQRVLSLGHVLDDATQLGKMRDNYTLALFTFANVSALIRAEKYTSAFLLLPFACWMAVLFSDRITLQLRLFLSELSFQLIASYLEAFDELKCHGVTQQKSDESPAITFAKSHYARRMLNTLCAFGVALQFGSDSLRMDSLGTHLVENAIGITRSTSADPRCTRIISTYARNELRKEIAERLGLTLYVQGRLNAGGCKIDPDSVMQEMHEELISKPGDWNSPDIITLARALCCPDTCTAMETEAREFANELNVVATSDTVELSEPNAAANCGILARLFEFHKSH